MLNTPLRRASFVVAVVGALVFCAGAYDWLTSFPNVFLNRTTSIPDYPRPDDQIPGRKSVIHVHRLCEWTETPPPNVVSMFDPSGPVMLYDQIVSIDGACAEKLLDRRSHNQVSILIALGKWSYQLMLRDDRRETSFGTPMNEDMSPQGLYRRRMGLAMQKEGVLRENALRVLDACTRIEPKLCVEVRRYVYVNAWSVLWSTWPLALGFVLLIGGLAGSLFLAQLAALWRISGGRLVEWIRRG